MEPLVILYISEKITKNILIIKIGLQVTTLPIPRKSIFDYLRSYFRVDWYQTTLRYWLNYNFINGAFSDQDQQVILYANFLKTTEDMVSNQRTLFSDDQIFLLSTIDIDKYFDSTETTLTIATDAAQQQAASLNSDSGQTIAVKDINSWWLRDSISTKSSIYCGIGTVITSDGETEDLSTPVYAGIRPALWINITKAEELRFISKP